MSWVLQKRSNTEVSANHWSHCNRFSHCHWERNGCLKVWSIVKIHRTRVPQNAIVPLRRPRPYSIIILNMHFIPKASIRANSQITASLYILAWHIWVHNSKPLASAPTWSMACKQTDCITARMSKLADPKLVLTPSKHKTFVWLYTILDQDVSPTLYKCYTNVLCLLGRSIFSQTFYISPMLVQCWASVTDVGLTLKQRWVSVWLE